jgi:hypothetical protein
LLFFFPYINIVFAKNGLMFQGGKDVSMDLRLCLVHPKNQNFFQDFPLHRIVGRIDGALNIDEKVLLRVNCGGRVRCVPAAAESERATE